MIANIMIKQNTQKNNEWHLALMFSLTLNHLEINDILLQLFTKWVPSRKNNLSILAQVLAQQTPKCWLALGRK